MNLLMAVALLLQDKAAEEAFATIEDTFVKAKTVALRCTIEITVVGAKRPRRGSASIFLKTGNKLRFSGGLEGSGMTSDSEWVSDGTKMVMAGFGDRPPQDSPGGLVSSLAFQLLRTGVGKGLFLPTTMTGDPDAAPVTDPKKIFLVTGIQAGPDDGESRTLSYRLKLHHEIGFSDVKLWYDPKTFQIRKRVLGLHEHDPGPAGATLVETYQEYVLDAEIPDTTFALPYDAAAVDLLKKIGATLESAKTVRIAFRVEEERSTPNDRFLSKKGAGRLLVKDGNKVRFDMEWEKADRQNLKPALVSDGTNLWLNGNGPPCTVPTPKDLRRNWLQALTRPGLEGGATLIEECVLRQYDLTLASAYSVSGLKQGPAEKGLNSLQCRLTRHSVNPYTVEQTLWYDPKTMQPVRFVRTGGNASQRSTLTETYDEIQLQGEIADETFKLPDEKK